MRKTIEEAFTHRADPKTLYDVLVCGGGPAGIGAALAASINGAKTAILESRSQFGGTASAAMWMEMNFLFKDNDETDRGGINKILVDELRKWGSVASQPGRRNGMPGSGGSLNVHPEYFKKAIYDLFERYGVDYLLYSPIVDVRRESSDSGSDGCSSGGSHNRSHLTGIVAGLKEGLTFFPARVIIDATGDGDVAWLAGCEMEEGEPETGWRPPVTVAFALGNVDLKKFYEWQDSNPGKRGHYEDIKKIAAEKGYNIPGWLGFNRTTLPGVVSVNNGTSQDYWVDPSKSYSLTFMEKIAIDEALDFVRLVRTEKIIPGLEDCFLMRTGGYAMPRDTRRLVGEYIFSNDDVMVGTEFPDVVASKYGGSDPVGNTRPYVGIRQGAQYPYRSYLPKNIDNLLVAGRCGSASMLGHYGGKSIGNMICIGQAAGVAGALCRKHSVQPKDLDVSLIQAALKQMGVSL